MLGPESPEEESIQIDSENKEDDKGRPKKTKRMPVEGAGSLELNSFKNPKTWKKSITKFFRNQMRSTRSNEGDMPSGSKDHFSEKDISPDQKWQSLGKMFRRHNMPDWGKSSNQEEFPQKKSLAVKKVLSSYFGKSQKTAAAPIPNEK